MELTLGDLVELEKQLHVTLTHVRDRKVNCLSFMNYFVICHLSFEIRIVMHREPSCFHWTSVINILDCLSRYLHHFILEKLCIRI
jgi:hypothetical protein